MRAPQTTTAARASLFNWRLAVAARSRENPSRFAPAQREPLLVGLLMRLRGRTQLLILFACLPQGTLAAGTALLPAKPHVALMSPDGPIEWTQYVDGAPWSFVLERRDQRARGLLVREDDGAGYRDVEPAPATTWRGEVFSPGRLGRVAASQNASGIRGLIRFDDGALFELRSDPDSGLTKLKIVPAVGFDADRCGTTEEAAPRSKDARSRREDHGAGGSPALALSDPPGGYFAAGATRLLEVAVDADHEFFTSNGSSVTTTLADIEAVMNAVEMIFETEISLRLAVTACVVRTARPDPYTATDPLALLNQLTAEWNGPLAGVPRDVTHLFTGKDLNGNTVGFSNTSVTCFPSFAYGLAQSHFTGSFASRVALTAHELGHGLGASHCSGSDCHIMCASIGGCGGTVSQFGANATQQISSFVASATCLDPIPGTASIPFVETFPLLTVDADRWQVNAGATVIVDPTAPSSPLALMLEGAAPSPLQQDSIQSVPLSLGSVGPASISFMVRAEGLGSGAALVVESSDASGSWLLVDRINPPGPASYSPREAALPSPSLFDGASIRLRTEGTLPGQRFFVDDIMVGVAPPGLPSVSSIAPTAVASLSGGVVTVTGGGFLGAGLQLTINGSPLPASSITVTNDTSLMFAAPPAPKLGPVSVLVSNNTGAAAPASLTYFAADPPALVVTPLAFNGQNLTVQYAGEPGELPFLLAGAGATFPWKGQTILSTPFLLPLGSLQGSGVASLSAPLSGVPPGQTIHLQVLTIDAPGAAASLTTSNIAQVFVLF